MASKNTKKQEPPKEEEAAQTEPQAPAAPQPAAPAPEVLEVPAALTVHDLASLMEVDPIEVIKQLMRLGQMLTINDVLDHEAAAEIAGVFGFDVQASAEEESGPGSLVISQDEEDADQLEPRPPVVTILGHVDHGKTTLLDAIRKTNVVSEEAGGITQHIGAYQVQADGKTITFLDTPGHEAFTAMRARGAQVTDIAVLVVAADDGIMPQTLEAIDHVRAAGVPQIVAINKVDRPEADQERVKRQLSENDILIEEWGGDVISVPVSALKGEGISELLDNMLVVAEVADLKANPNQMARGVVVEARVDKSKGPVATVLVQTGTLRAGDNVVAGSVRGRIRAMLGDQGQQVSEAGPSVPVEILGLNDLPMAGDILTGMPDEKSAREKVKALERERHAQGGRGDGVTLEEIYSRIESGEVKALNLIVKTDVQGSIDAVRAALEPLSTEQTKVNLIHAATGSITESDVMLAAASDAIIVGFNSPVEPGARTLATQENLDVRFYDIIYNLIDDIEKALKGLLAPVTRDVLQGYATVRAIFSMGRRGNVAGIYVNDGVISRGARIRVMRNDSLLYEGPISSLRHFKDDVREVNAGLEGGIVVDGFQDYKEGDILEGHLTETEPVE